LIGGGVTVILLILKWAGERPEEPRVPLYTLIEDEDCVGAAFGQLRKGEVAFKGVCETAGIAPGVIPEDKLKANLDLPRSWREIKAQWTKNLENLAMDFIDGIADVMPKSASVCEFCHLPALCR
jgi:hypothetical protein